MLAGGNGCRNIIIIEILYENVPDTATESAAASVTLIYSTLFYTNTVMHIVIKGHLSGQYNTSYYIICAGSFLNIIRALFS